MLDQLRHICQQLRTSKVLENYSYMTLLQLASALIGLVVYPIVIRRLGMETYGLYAFMLAIVLYFQVVVEFGFDFPALKAVSLHRDHPQELSRIVSSVFWAKTALFVVALLAACIAVYCIPNLRHHSGLFAVLFVQNMINILLPQWYFQGMKQMKIPTIINLICRLLQIPLVLWLVWSPSNLIQYAAIVSGTMLLGALVAMVYMLTHGIRLIYVPMREIATYFRAGWPFFLTDLASSLKERALTNLIGVFLGMSEVAIYDLAVKVVQIPRMFTQSINKALFPEVITNASAARVRSILHYERWIGLIMTIAVALLGYWIVWLLGGKDMLGAYPIAVILSISIYTWLVVGAYLQFVFIPANRYALVTWNQVVALLTCLSLCVLGLWHIPSVYVVVVAIVLSGLAEIVFCRTLCKRYQLL